MPENGGGLGAWTPQWASNANAYIVSVLTHDAGVTFPTAGGGHPLGDNSNYSIAIDHSFNPWVQGVFGNAVDVALVPASAKRWGSRWQFWAKFNGYPAAGGNNAFTLFQPIAGSLDIALRTDHKVMLATISAGTLTSYAITSVTFDLNHWYLFDFWIIVKDTAGNTLATPQHVLQIYDQPMLGSPPVRMLDELNVLKAGAYSVTANPRMGDDNSQPIESIVHNLANIYGAWEDANDPYGIIRVYPLSLAANGTDVGTWSNDYTYWDDVPGTAPDDATTVRLSTSTVADTATSLCTAVPTTILGANDRVIGVTVAHRVGGVAVTINKTTFSHRAIIRNATNERIATTYSNSSADAYLQATWFWNKNPDNNFWTPSDLTGGAFEIGIDGKVGAAGAGIAASTIGGFVAYQKAGETLGPIPATPGSTKRRVGVF